MKSTILLILLELALVLAFTSVSLAFGRTVLEAFLIGIILAITTSVIGFALSL